MNGYEDRLAALGKELGVADWEHERPAERLFVWRFFLGGGELPGWRLHRSYRLPGNGLPPGIQSVWTRDDGALLRVDVFEAPSSAGARRALLAVAGEHQAAGALSRADGVGEVALAGPRESSLALVRGNMVMLVRGGGGTREPIREPAAALDTLITGGVQPNVKTEARGGRTAVLRQEELDALSARVLAADEREPPQAWFRFRSTAGEVVLEKGRPVLRPGRSDATVPESVTVEIVQPADARASGPDLSALGFGL